MYKDGVMLTDGLYLSHGADNRALVVIREENGNTLWLRDFRTAKFALDALEENVLSQHVRADIEAGLAGNKGFSTKKVVVPDGGYASFSFRRYVLSPAS